MLLVKVDEGTFFDLESVAFAERSRTGALVLRFKGADKPLVIRDAAKARRLLAALSADGLLHDLQSRK